MNNATSKNIFGPIPCSLFPVPYSLFHGTSTQQWPVSDKPTYRQVAAGRRGLKQFLGGAYIGLCVRATLEQAERGVHT